MSSPPLVDANARPIPIDHQLASGGEGAVFTIQNNSIHVAKVYHRPPTAQTAEKLTTMVGLANPQLSALSAWPLGLLYHARTRQLAGFMMPRLTDCQPIQHLYNPTQRLRCFPRSGWDFQVRAAKNLAAAFDEVHKAGCLVGDVNESNVQVSTQALIRLIDCDSFQVRQNGRAYLCEVGVAHYIPPELQGKSLRGLIRSENHDRFGLAVLIYQLLFVGRHPFAGVYGGSGDPSFEELIREFRFAQGPAAHSWGMAPPPYTPTFADIPPNLAALFRRAFERGSETGNRPRPTEWLVALQHLEQSIATCTADSGHKYWHGASSCVWCRLADHGGPEYYFGVAGGGGTFVVDEATLQSVLRRLESAREVAFPYDRSLYKPARPALAKQLPASLQQLFDAADAKARELGSEKGRHDEEERRERDLDRKAIERSVAADEEDLIRRQLQLDNELQSALEDGNKQLRERLHQIRAEHDAEVRDLEVLKAGIAQELEQRQRTVDEELRLALNAFEVQRSERRQELKRLLGFIGLGAVAGLFLHFQPAIGVVGLVVSFAACVSSIASCCVSLLRSNRQRVLDIRRTKHEEDARAAYQVNGYEMAINGRYATAKAGLKAMKSRLEHELAERKKSNREAIAQARGDSERRRKEARTLLERERERACKSRRQLLQGLENAAHAAAKAYEAAFRAELARRQDEFALAKDALSATEQLWQTIVAQYVRERGAVVHRVGTLVSECRSLASRYQAELQPLIERAEVAARLRHMRLHSIADADIPKIGAGRKQLLNSRGIVTAADIDHRIYRIKGFGEALTGNLMAWKNEVLQQFRFDPTTSVSASDRQSLAIRFRRAQQDVLADLSRQMVSLESLAPTCQAALEKLVPEVRRGVARYEQLEAELLVLYRQR